MDRLWRSVIVVLLVVIPMPRVWAQLTNKEAPVVVAHVHLNVTSVAAHKKFWVDTLGGTAMKLGAANIDAIKFPGLFVLLREQPPTGPTRGTAFDHIGFAAPDVPALAAKIVAAGYTITDGREPDPTKPTPTPATGTSAVYGKFAYLLGPDGAKIELVTADAAKGDRPAPPPLAYHHIHFINKQYVEMQQWYMKAFDATLRPGQTDFFIGADLPGVGYSLNFFRWEGDPRVVHVPTAGRVYDHIGFEVRNLEAFCKRLEAKGLKLTSPYRKAAAMNHIGTATLIDPWGVSLELTEGLDQAY